jgi:hypothetical protein
MGFDYATPERRTTRGDLKKKRKNRGYKRGGKYRSTDIKEGNFKYLNDFN